jgi:predicted TIM-barrel fold metal-dependent hydrolase
MIKRNGYFICEADEGDMTQSLKEVGEDHILMATDYPRFDSEFPHTVSGIRARADLTAKQKDKILGENAAKLLNL